jgi:hypothetical protein
LNTGALRTEKQVSRSFIENGFILGSLKDPILARIIDERGAKTIPFCLAQQTCDKRIGSLSFVKKAILWKY